MKKIANVSELEKACASVAESGEKEYVLVCLTKEVLDFLYSIYGKNRPETASNISSLYKAIKDGEWNDDLGAFTINASATWLCSGHHRLLAIIASGDTSLKGEFQILPDALAEKKFLSDDTMIATRTSAQQASLFLHIRGAKDIRAVASKIEYYKGNPNQKITVDGIRDFSEKWETLLESHHFFTQSVATRYIPRAFFAIAIHLKINGMNAMSDSAFAMIDEVANPNTSSESARLMREEILSHGTSDSSPAINIFMKSIVKGDLVRSKAFAKEVEMPLIRDALGIVNTSQRLENATVGSRNYFKKVIREMKKEAK